MNPGEQAPDMTVPAEDMTIHDQARSEVREKLFSALSERQKKMLSEVKDMSISHERKAQHGIPGGQIVEEDMIAGQVRLEGIYRSITLSKTKKGEGPVEYWAAVDGETKSREDARQLYDFYQPIAEIINEDKHYPTETSDALVKQKELDALLGK